MKQEIDWKVFQASLDPDERKEYLSLVRQIKRAKEFIQFTSEWLALAKALSSKDLTACEKHYIQHCAECSKVNRFDALLRKANKRLRMLRFAFRTLPSVVELLGPLTQSVSQPRTERSSVRDTFYWPAVERQEWDSLAANFRTHGLRARDIGDNLALIESVIRERA